MARKTGGQRLRFVLGRLLFDINSLSWFWYVEEEIILCRNSSNVADFGRGLDFVSEGILSI